MPDIEIQFLNHIVPQFLSLIIITIMMLRVIFQYKESEIGELIYPLFFLLFGKIALIIFFQVPEFVKACVDASLAGYFSVMPLILKRMFKINKNVVLLSYLAMTGVVVSILIPELDQGFYIFLADLILIFIMLFSDSKVKFPLIISFLILGSINIINVSFKLDFTIYAWTEVIGQIMYCIGLNNWMKERWVNKNKCPY